MNEEIEPGDIIKIVADGCNNSRAPEYISGDSLRRSETLYRVSEVKKGTVYQSSSFKSHTLILDTGHPVWANHCKLVCKKDSINDHYKLI